MESKELSLASLRTLWLSLSDVSWREEDPYILIEDENVTIPEQPAAASTPVQTSTGDETSSLLCSPQKEALLSIVDCHMHFENYTPGASGTKLKMWRL